ncbi:uncharacterized protein EV420DRAFT_1539041 [Desarmillaria tabescens]|uniref:Uncharacterized protein n=1 Tax=Armillaria tabescens TaxID=1929756 RepID=A0AA39KHX8_ARMTA|nr:uncharacterized protein EV420DRAFT_1539041 [Desarmillaria tabescens]KAK0459223.1 hypothetical protein EV420DRAFT_1539041 [Desarmillaria tabescens]
MSFSVSLLHAGMRCVTLCCDFTMFLHILSVLLGQISCLPSVQYTSSSSKSCLEKASHHRSYLHKCLRYDFECPC